MDHNPAAQEKSIVVSLSFCEGKDARRIDRLVSRVAAQPGIRLINVHPNRRHQRTLLIFGGASANVLPATHELAGAVRTEINLSSFHKSPHVFGALDMVSFVPLFSRQLPETIALARRFAAELAKSWEIPVYLFAEASRLTIRREIQHFRHFDYRDLPALLAQKEWRPDLGPPRFDAALGASIVGARRFHINIALYFDTRNLNLISELIGVGRESAGGHNDLAVLRSAEPVRHLSRILEDVHTFVDDFPEQRLVRVTCSIPDYRKAPVQQVVEGFETAADQVGVGFIGSQLLGFAPGEAFENEGDGEGKLPLEGMAGRLRLNAVEPFSAERQILDNHFLSEC